MELKNRFLLVNFSLQGLDVTPTEQAAMVQNVISIYERSSSNQAIPFQTARANTLPLPSS